MANPKMVKMKILRSCYIRGVVRAVGDVVTVTENEARETCWMKKGELVNPEPAAPTGGKAPEPAAPTGGKQDKKEKGGESK